MISRRKLLVAGGGGSVIGVGSLFYKMSNCDSIDDVDTDIRLAGRSQNKTYSEEIAGRYTLLEESDQVRHATSYLGDGDWEYEYYDWVPWAERQCAQLVVSRLQSWGTEQGWRFVHPEVNGAAGDEVVELQLKTYAGPDGCIHGEPKPSVQTVADTAPERVHAAISLDGRRFKQRYDVVVTRAVEIGVQVA